MNQYLRTAININSQHGGNNPQQHRSHHFGQNMRQCEFEQERRDFLLFNQEQRIIDKLDLMLIAMNISDMRQLLLHMLRSISTAHRHRYRHIFKRHFPCASHQRLFLVIIIIIITAILVVCCLLQCGRLEWHRLHQCCFIGGLFNHRLGRRIHHLDIISVCICSCTTIAAATDIRIRIRRLLVKLDAVCDTVRMSAMQRVVRHLRRRIAACLLHRHRKRVNLDAIVHSVASQKIFLLRHQLLLQRLHRTNLPRHEQDAHQCQPANDGQNGGTIPQNRLQRIARQKIRAIQTETGQHARNHHHPQRGQLLLGKQDLPLRRDKRAHFQPAKRILPARQRQEQIFAERGATRRHIHHIVVLVRLERIVFRVRFRQNQGQVIDPLAIVVKLLLVLDIDAVQHARHHDKVAHQRKYLHQRVGHAEVAIEEAARLAVALGGVAKRESSEARNTRVQRAQKHNHKRARLAQFPAIRRTRRFKRAHKFIRARTMREVFAKKQGQRAQSSGRRNRWLQLQLKADPHGQQRPHHPEQQERAHRLQKRDIHALVGELRQIETTEHKHAADDQRKHDAFRFLGASLTQKPFAIFLRLRVLARLASHHHAQKVPQQRVVDIIPRVVGRVQPRLRSIRVGQKRHGLQCDRDRHQQARQRGLHKSQPMKIMRNTKVFQR
mmetsp:Transcript_18393/g.29155  ORF Transcript_18393/g.29155 Transcript_18393/m.29155 type:complete len:664 (+) Transcript_18393:4349-6340(+)